MPQCKICASELTSLYTDLFDDRYGFPGLFSVFVCVQCQFAQTFPEPTQEQLHTIYTDYYPRKTISVGSVQRNVSFSPGVWFRFTSWLKGTRNTCHYHVQAGQTVLDVGCGDGSSLLDMQCAGATAYGTEYDKNVEPVAQQLKLNIFFGDVKDAPFADELFDVITMSQLLEHISDPVHFIALLKQKLKPGGSIIMAFPNRLSFNGRRSGRNWINWHIPYHLNFFSRSSIERLAKQADLTVTAIRTYTPNVWLQLQTMHSARPAKIGQPNPIWTVATLEQSSSLWRRRWTTGLALLRSLLRVPITRLQDAIGQGDSFLVILKKPLT